MEKLLKILSKRFWICLFLFLIVITIVSKLLGFDYISDVYALGMMGQVSILIGLNVLDKIKKK